MVKKYKKLQYCKKRDVAVLEIGNIHIQEDYLNPDIIFCCFVRTVRAMTPRCGAYISLKFKQHHEWVRNYFPLFQSALFLI